ncbi:MAG: anti-anti-sigma factor [Methylococcales bacterium]|nr:anti-anti-sigma factor [Methylococcales bacterium]
MKIVKITKAKDEHYEMEGDLVFLTINKKAIKALDFIKKEKKVNINLEKIKLADSAGLALVIECIKYSKINETKLSFSHVPEQLLTLAKLGGFDMSPYLSITSNHF